MGILAAYVVPHPPLIVPAVGRGEEVKIQATIDAYREIAQRIAEYAPDTIVVTSPHAPLFRDCFYVSSGPSARGDMARFGAPQASMEVVHDRAFAEALAVEAERVDIPLCDYPPEDTVLDHATFVPLWFVNEVYTDYFLVRVGLSALPSDEHEALGECLARAADASERRVVLIASGDLSHKLKSNGPYGFAVEGPQFDEELVSLLDAGDMEGLFEFDSQFLGEAAECGLGSFQIMAGALKGGSYTHELLSYEGPFGVGYCVAAFEAEDLSLPDEDPYVALARESVEQYVRTGKPLERSDDLPAEMLEESAGVFVSLHEHGDLRGCIGTIAPTTSCIADEIIQNGVSACSRDPRFPAVQEDELDYLSYSVDVLFPPEPIVSFSELDPKRYGVIVSQGYKHGLLLPNLDGIDSVEDQVAIAKQKAGIHPFDNDVDLERFEVVRHDIGGEARKS